MEENKTQLEIKQVYEGDFESFEEGYDKLKSNVQTSEEIVSKLEEKYGNALKKEDLIMLEKVLGTEFMKFVLLMKPSKEVLMQANTDQKDIQARTIEYLINEVKTLELQKGISFLRQISLTISELKEFQIKLLTKDTKDEIEFLQSQIVDSTQKPQSTKSIDLISGTNLSKILEEKYGKELTFEFMESMDSFWYNFIDDNFKAQNITDTVKSNMSTGLNFLFLDILANQSDKSKDAIVEQIKGLTKKPINIKGFLEFTKNLALGENKFYNKTQSFLKLIESFANNKKNIADWNCEKNKYLANPYEFYNLLKEYLNGSTDQSVFEKLSKGESQDFKETKLSKKQKEHLQQIADKAGSGKEIKVIEGLNVLKKEGKNSFAKSGDLIMGVKEFFDMLGLGDLMVKIWDWICKFVGYEGGFAEFEQEYIFGKVDINIGQKNSLKNLHSEYKSHSSKPETMKNGESKVKILDALELDEKSTDYIKIKEILNGTNVGAFKTTLEKNEIEGVVGKKYGKYFIPDSIIIKYSGEFGLDIRSNDGNIDQEKIKKLSINEQLSDQIIDRFYVQTGKDLLSNSDLKNKLVGAEDFTFLMYSNYILPNYNVDKSKNILHYKEYLLANNYDIASGKLIGNKDRYVPGSKIPSSRFNELFVGGEKSLGQLSFEESKSLALKIFGDGPGTQLMFKLSQGNPVFIARVIALGRHEGGLVFGRRNLDPTFNRTGQQNIGTFQISDKNVDAKYADTMRLGKQLCEKYSIRVAEGMLNDAQKDLLSWFGYVNAYRGGESTFASLRNQNLSDSQTAYLMSTTIQGGIAAIGNSVVAQLKHLSVNLSKLA